MTAHSGSGAETPGEELVSFDDPPVNEVVLSVQLSDEVFDDVLVLSKFFPEIRDSFPKHETKPPIPEVKEQFGVLSDAGEDEVKLVSGPLSPRYWFLSENENELLQVQPNRFASNWRSISGDESYPRFKVLKPAFESHFSRLVDCLDSDAFPKVDLCEITYINHIQAGDEPLGNHLPLSDYLTLVSPDEGAPLAEEDSQFVRRYVLRPNGSDDPVGRFYVTAMPAYRRSDEMPIYVLTLIARGTPSADDMAGILSFFDWGHELIVTEFDRITPGDMHEEWGKR